jgi:hypothetical protein
MRGSFFGNKRCLRSSVSETQTSSSNVGDFVTCGVPTYPRQESSTDTSPRRLATGAMRGPVVQTHWEFPLPKPGADPSLRKESCRVHLARAWRAWNTVENFGIRCIAINNSMRTGKRVTAWEQDEFCGPGKSQAVVIPVKKCRRVGSAKLGRQLYCTFLKSVCHPFRKSRGDGFILRSRIRVTWCCARGG